MEKTNVDGIVGANKSQHVQQTALEKFNARLAKTNQIQNQLKERKEGEKMKTLLKSKNVNIAIEKVVAKKDGSFYVPKLEELNGVLYSVDINGNLHQIDTNTLVEKPVYRSVNKETKKPIVFALDVDINQSNNKIMIDTLKALGYNVEVKDVYSDPNGYYHILNVTTYNDKKYVPCGTSLILLKNVKVEKKIVLTREKNGKYVHSYLDVNTEYLNSNNETSINAVFNAAFAYLNK